MNLGGCWLLLLVLCSSVLTCVCVSLSPALPHLAQEHIIYLYNLPESLELIWTLNPSPVVWFLLLRSQERPLPKTNSFKWETVSQHIFGHQKRNIWNCWINSPLLVSSPVPASVHNELWLWIMKTLNLIKLSPLCLHLNGSDIKCLQLDNQILLQLDFVWQYIQSCDLKSG